MARSVSSTNSQFTAVASQTSSKYDNLEGAELDNFQKQCYQVGSLLLAISFLINGLAGLTQSKTAKQDFHRSHYIMLETIFMGRDFDPTRKTLDENFLAFSFMYHLQKILMLILSFLIVVYNKQHGYKLVWATLLGIF